MSLSRRIRSSAYLFTLALIDAFFLLDLLPGMIHTAFVTNLYRKINFICCIQTYISFVASFSHIWMVLAFTAERFYAVNFPLKHMSQCTSNLSRIVILIIIVPALLCYIHPAFFVSGVDNRGQCREKDHYERYLHNLNIIDTIMTMFLPFILVSILNILIIRKLFCSKTFRQHVFANGSRYHYRRTSDWNKTVNLSPIQQPSTISNLPQTSPLSSSYSQRITRPFRLTTTQRTVALYRTFTNSESPPINPPSINNNSNLVNEQQQTTINPKTKQISSSKRHESAQRHVLTELRLTKMLLAISLTCLLLNFPSYYLRFIFLYEQARASSLPPVEIIHSNEIDFSFYRDVIFLFLSYLSYSINIVIYLLFGGNFRRALKRLFSLKKSKRSENFNSTMRGKNYYYNDKLYDYESTGITVTSANISMRSQSKSFKLRELASVRRQLNQQPSILSQQK